MAKNRSPGLSRGLAPSRSSVGRQTVVSRNVCKKIHIKVLMLYLIPLIKQNMMFWIAEISQRASGGHAEQRLGAANAQVLRERSRDSQKAYQDCRGG